MNVMMRLIKAILFLACYVLSINLYAQETLPHLYHENDQILLKVDNAPFYMLAGELGNSSASDSAYLSAIWPTLKTMHLNSVLIPVYWELLEPEEGQFDFSLIDQMIRESRQYDIKLVLLWFGTWKNSMSCYVPGWVKNNPKRFPRISDKNGHAAEILSPFYPETLNADKKAFTRLLQHIAKKDTAYQIIMVQVENEIGMLPDARDYSKKANDQFEKEVPQVLLQYLQKHKNKPQTHMLQLWAAQGHPKSGNWETVFGKSLATNELFNAWYQASYTNQVAHAGKEVLPLPLYVNCALNRPGLEPGGYPSGGPLPHLLDLWKLAAPDIDLLAPDIYHGDFKKWSQLYDIQNNPLFIPEIQLSNANGSEALYVFGQHHAIGYSPFSIESTPNPEKASLKKSYALLQAITPLLSNPTKSGVWLNHTNQRDTLTFGDYEVVVSHDYTLGWSPESKSEEWPAAGGIIIQTAPNELWVIGSGLVVTFSNKKSPKRNTGLLSVDQATKVDKDWRFRRLNGDQTHQGRHVRLPMDQWDIQRVRLYDFQ